MTKEELLQELWSIKDLATTERNWRLAYAIYSIRQKLQQERDVEFATKVDSLLLEILDQSRYRRSAAIAQDVYMYIWHTARDLAENMTAAAFNIFYEWGFKGGTYYELTDFANCPQFEFVSIRRESTTNPDKTVVYHFDIGNLQARDIYITFTKELASHIPYDWGIKQISFIQPTMVEYKDKDGVVKQGVGELTKSFNFDYTLDYLAGRDPTEIGATYERVVLDPRGYMLTPLSEQLVAFFRYGEPSAHAPK